MNDLNVYSSNKMIKKYYKILKCVSENVGWQYYIVLIHRLISILFIYSENEIITNEHNGVIEISLFLYETVH